MKQKNLKIDFRYLAGNIACLSVDSISGESVHNDINNEEAIIIFNSLVGEKADCQTVKTLIKENKDLKKQLEESKLKHKQLKDLEKIQLSNSYQTEKLSKLETQQKEFIKYLEDEIKERKNYDKKNNCEWQGYNFYKEILSKYKEIIGSDK